MTDALSVTLKLDDSTNAALLQDERALALLDSYVIDCNEMAEVVNTELRATIGRIKQLKTMKADFVAPAKQIIANAEKWFDPAIEARAAFEGGLRLKLSNWSAECQRIAAEVRQKAEAEDRKRRQEAEKLAAAAQAKAAEEAAEARRKAEAAERERLAAVALGNAKAAAKAAAEAAKQTERAAAVVENAAVVAQETILAAQAQVVAIPEAAKIAGFSMRDNWVAELAPGVDEATALAGVVAAVAAGRTDLLALLQIDASACNRLAKALRKAFNVPGFVAVNKPISTSRAK